MKNNTYAISVIIGFLILIAACGVSGVIPATWNAIVSEMNNPKPPPPIEVQTSEGALIDLNGDTAPTFTGYEMEFPKGTVDWRVTYGVTYERFDRGKYTVITPTYWCKTQDSEWLSCQPVIKERAS